MANLEYSELKLQEYLKNENIFISQKRFLFKMRTNMLKVAFNMGQKETQCPLCFMDQDDQRHLMDCMVINLYMDDDISNIKYDDIYSDEQYLIEKASAALMGRFQRREVLMRLP